MKRIKSSVVSFVVAIGLFAGAGVVSADPPADKQHKEKKDKADKAMDKQDKQQRKEEKKAAKKHHKNGKALMGDKLKGNGHHVLEQKGDVTASVDVQNGKIAGVHAKHAKKGDLKVTKYKTNKKMALGLGPVPVQYASLSADYQEYAGTIYIGYSYIDDYGDEEIYWFPIDIIIDGDAGAIDYYDDGY